MQENEMTREDAQRIFNKHIRAKHVLSQVEKGEPDNLIDLRSHFIRELYYNNRAAYLKIVDTVQKVK